ncbi:P-loop containing nucleoside triphosphate hydrolase protein [Suillus subalutaceus]|uniref:P-loop containing nucleoside triphosphate hydrolase protein n=1 Tax=Suillus subalutaceus TaxID=48586 RepID=UPI001B866F56|nr:P-loop containing nucleoside triphosphate hydrolase protein [Suillus subalutaceus]KAG1857362.1 P-loop containing nucleoside triphosphate hydrolase protein [Suillus subalutaceus]
MDALKSMLSPLGVGSANAIQDTLKLVVIGGTVETARRASAGAWHTFLDSFFLTAHFSQEDYPYDWLMHWLSKQPAWGRSREFEITTRTVGRNGLTQSTTGDLEEEDEDEDEDALVHGRRKRKVAFMPSIDTTHTIYYRGHWLRITRTKRYPDYGHGSALKIRTYGCWRWNGARQKRPMSSIVLQPGVKDMLLADCKDFLCSEDWYAERGIPFRRGYLLHGVPGSGKTSLIHSLAGELGLDIYVVSLSSKGMSDNTLTTLMGHVPSRCILLLEDLDAAFTRSVSRDASSTGAPTTSNTNSTTTETNDGSTLSLSGLLNSLDGVAAAEGRLLFATTNHIERLDPALSRPGRMDVWVNFTHATKWQAEGIFKCFFPSKPAGASAASPSEELSKDVDTSQKNLPLPKRKAPSHTIPVLDETEISELAKRFADSIPENELSVAALQGYLLKNKVRPRECVDEVAQVIEERETREKLKKEKAEREAKEKKETEEKERKEKEEKVAKEQEEKDVKEKTERKERAKTKKAHRAEAALKLEGASSSTTSLTTTEPVVVLSTSESSSSESDSSNGGIEADTEESITSEEEPDKAADSTGSGDSGVKDSNHSKEKWVAVKADS